MNASNNHSSRELLQDRKLKATATRVEVLNLMQAYKKAMPLSELQKSMEETDRVTLYRTLNVLLKKGLIHKALISKEETYYALCGHKCNENSHLHNHIHFKCTSCQAVSCETLEREIKISLPSLRIDQINILATGLCRACNPG